MNNPEQPLLRGLGPAGSAGDALTEDRKLCDAPRVQIRPVYSARIGAAGPQG